MYEIVTKTCSRPHEQYIIYKLILYLDDLNYRLLYFHVRVPRIYIYIYMFMYVFLGYHAICFITHHQLEVFIGGKTCNCDFSSNMSLR